MSSTPGRASFDSSCTRSLTRPSNEHQASLQVALLDKPKAPLKRSWLCIFEEASAWVEGGEWGQPKDLQHLKSGWQVRALQPAIVICEDLMKVGLGTLRSMPGPLCTHLACPSSGGKAPSAT